MKPNNLPKIDIVNARLHKKALSLSYFTVGYNILEGIVSIFAGLLAGSIALVGFGLDSFVLYEIPNRKINK